MKTINNGNTYHVYDDSVHLYNNLPPRVYEINFDPRLGYSLIGKPHISVNEKVYGIHIEKAEKIVNTFLRFERSLGVILSGDKGIGKSLFGKMLCQKMIENGYPVLICSKCTPDLAQFIDSMDQELMILFDEFDKTFPDDKSEDSQTSLLSMFDGISMNKKLFCVTCNDVWKINDFLVNRPGRFHYHLRFDYPTDEQIEVYMKDHLPSEKWQEIKKIVDFSHKTKLNYDCLRAISYELCYSDSFEKAIADLNIIRLNDNPHYDIWLYFNDGFKMHTTSRLDLFNQNSDSIAFGHEEVHEHYLYIGFIPSKCMFNPELGGFYLSKENLTIAEDSDADDEESYLMKENAEFVNKHRKTNVTGMLIRKRNGDSHLHYFTV